MGLKHQRNWVVLVVLATFVLNSVISEGATLSNTSVEPVSSTRRKLLQIEDTENDVVRIDPLDHFRKYRGQYDITNKHYWSSTIFTGIYGFAMGFFWLVTGVACCTYLLTRSCCFKSKNRKLRRRIPCQKQCYLLPLVLATIFTVLAMITSGVALGGIVKFHSRAKIIMTVITNTADKASNTMYDATEAMRKIAVNLIESGTSEGDEAAKFLASTSDKLDYEATGIAKQAERNRSLAGKALTIMYILTSTTISLNLAASIALTVSGILRFRRVLYTLVILSWFLTVVCWLFFGTYFFIEKFTGDTCTALKNFQQNPENSSLSTILPCGQLSSARTVLSDVSIGLYEVLYQVNVNISIIRASSLPSLNYVCNPFSGPPDFLYQPKNCPANSIHIGDIPQMLKMLTCSGTSGTNCEEGFISNSQYNVIVSYTSSVQNLLDAYPEMQNLVNCQLVKDTFSDILVNHCRPVKRYIETTCIAVMLLSIVMMVLVSTWASNVFPENRNFADGSVKPNTLP